jgi:hypothetical protein
MRAKGANESMDDTALVHAFESCSLKESEFSHRAHLRVAWLYLTSGVHFEDAALRFCRGLRRYAESLGKADRYHETITWAFLAIVSERQRECAAKSFEDFANQHPDLFEPRLAPLFRYYDAETLHSDLARSTFVLPRSPSGLRRTG